MRTLVAAVQEKEQRRSRIVHDLDTLMNASHVGRIDLKLLERDLRESLQTGRSCSLRLRGTFRWPGSSSANCSKRKYGSHQF